MALLIGYWFGSLTNDSSISTYIPDTSEINTELLKAQQQINHLQHKVTALSTTASDISKSTRKTRTAGSGLDIIANKVINQSNVTAQSTEEQAQSTHAWTRKATDRIAQSLLLYGLSETQISEVNCDSSMCVAKFNHNSSAGHFQLLQHLTVISEFSKGFVIKTDEDDHLQKTMVYFSRASEHSS